MKVKSMIDFIEVMLDDDEDLDAQRLEKLFGALRELRRQVDKQ
jgi:hypothetical protein